MSLLKYFQKNPNPIAKNKSKAEAKKPGLLGRMWNRTKDFAK
jgi:hypothetical protein